MVLQINQSKANTIYDYIITEQNEINIKESTKETKIKRIAHLSKHFHHQQSFYSIKFVVNEMNCSNVKIIYKKSYCKHSS